MSATPSTKSARRINVPVDAETLKALHRMKNFNGSWEQVVSRARKNAERVADAAWNQAVEDGLVDENGNFVG